MRLSTSVCSLRQRTGLLLHQDYLDQAYHAQSQPSKRAEEPSVRSAHHNESSENSRPSLPEFGLDQGRRELELEGRLEQALDDQVFPLSATRSWKLSSPRHLVAVQDDHADSNLDIQFYATQFYPLREGDSWKLCPGCRRRRPNDHEDHNRVQGQCLVPHVATVIYRCPACREGKPMRDPAHTNSADEADRCRNTMRAQKNPRQRH